MLARTFAQRDVDVRLSKKRAAVNLIFLQEYLLLQVIKTSAQVLHRFRPLVLWSLVFRAPSTLSVSENSNIVS